MREDPQLLPSLALRPDGSREKIRVADVTGPFQVGKKWVYAALIAFFVALPFVQVGGQRLVLLDIAHRRFYLFGLTFNAQDIYLVFFLVTGFAFALFYLTAVAGRVWCGWGCPQTVFLEGFYRKVERWLEGPRSAQMRLAAQGWTYRKVRILLVKHAIFVASSMLLAALFLAYFVPLSFFLELGSHPILTAWLIGMTAVIYLNFAWFREQLCLIVCPYGRLQSVLTDDDSLVIGYDQNRGEPRGKESSTERGHCIDCGRCVVVCPTGIDIRNGLQMECIGCANCIDACDEIMEKTNQPKGLVRYDSLNGLEGKKRRFLRPRVYVYTVLLFIGMGMFSLFIAGRTSLEANAMRLPGPPYVLTQGKIRNQLEIHITNKLPRKATLALTPRPIEGVKFILPVRRITLESLHDRRLPLFVEIAAADFQGQFAVEVDVADEKGRHQQTARIQFLGP